MRAASVAGFIASFIAVVIGLNTSIHGLHFSISEVMGWFRLEVDRISASVLAPNVDKWALSADIRFRPKAVVLHSVHFRFRRDAETESAPNVVRRRAAVGKFGGCRK